MQGRLELDEALDFRGNYYFGCVGNACIGCATWKRSFLVLPRWALTLAAMALAGALVPWAFGSSLESFSSGGTPVNIALMLQLEKCLLHNNNDIASANTQARASAAVYQALVGV